jgi:hypothetical protein
MHKGDRVPMLYQADKLLGQEVWKVTLTIKGDVFTTFSTDKDLFKRISDLDESEKQMALNEAFFKSFEPEMLNFIKK